MNIPIFSLRTYNSIHPEETRDDSIEDDGPESRRKCFSGTFLYGFVCLGLLGLILAGIAVIVGLYMNAPSIANPTSAEFALYKNRNLRECAIETTSSSSQLPVNCSLLDGHLLSSVPSATWYRSAAAEDRYFLTELRYPKNASSDLLSTQATTDLTDANSYTWCDLMSCLGPNDFEPIPSTPRASAYSYTGLMLWANLTMITITAVLAFDSDLDGPTHHSRDECPGFGVLFWISNLISLASVVFWTYSLVGLAGHPKSAAPISVIAWVTLWVAAYSTKYHPLSCWLAHRGETTRISVTTVLAVLAVTYWFCSVVILKIDWAGILGNFSPIVGATPEYPVYDCLESQITNVMGSLRCSAAEVCAKEWLFYDMGFNF